MRWWRREEAELQEIVIIISKNNYGKRPFSLIALSKLEA